MNIQRLNVQSTLHVNSLSLVADPSRGRFEIVQLTGDSTVEFGQGGGLLPIPAEYHYVPTVCPTGQIDILTTGSYVIVTTSNLHEDAGVGNI